MCYHILFHLGDDRRIITRDPKAQKSGFNTGTPVNIVSNHFRLIQLPNFNGLFQYHVGFQPEIQSTKLKCALLHELDDILGTVRCFDGMTMFLPLQLPDREIVRHVTTRQGDDVTIKIMFTNEVPANSPSVLQLLNILFRRYIIF